LIANWWEENELKNATGVARVVSGAELAKTTRQLHQSENLLLLTKQFTDANERILGKKTNEFP